MSRIESNRAARRHRDASRLKRQLERTAGLAPDRRKFHPRPYFSLESPVWNPFPEKSPL
jgi:hypothetical protein